MEKPSHLNQKGEAHMVDISKKEETKRKAKAEGFVTVKKSTIETITDGNLDKGDLFGSARIAGIMAAKKTSDLIPLCHILSISSISIDITIIVIIIDSHFRLVAETSGRRSTMRQTDVMYGFYYTSTT